MKLLLVAIFLIQLELILQAESSALDDFVNDDSDIYVVRYDLKSVSNSTNLFVTYRLNVTSLKWFDGKIELK